VSIPAHIIFSGHGAASLQRNTHVMTTQETDLLSGRGQSKSDTYLLPQNPTCMGSELSLCKESRLVENGSRARLRESRSKILWTVAVGSHVPEIGVIFLRRALRLAPLTMCHIRSFF
jgi:hypothetical protein